MLKNGAQDDASRILYLIGHGLQSNLYLNKQSRFISTEYTVSSMLELVLAMLALLRLGLGCVCYTLMSHLLMGTKFSDFATFVFSMPWFRGSARSCHISFHTVKY